MITSEMLKKDLNTKEMSINTLSLSDDADLFEQGTDSLDMMNIALMIEEKYQVKIPDAELAKLRTLRDIVIYINQYSK